jgi:EAL domain-containing protein (putative c-di-GMP-specific phosphodiesterase class I)/ActR/RegA family two-component response regulator
VENQASGSGHTGTKGRILVVDDEAPLRRVLERILSRAGHEVVTAEGGATAMEKLTGSQFDAVLSDISMPGMNGLDLLRAVREHDLDIPVLIMTGAPDVSTAVRAMEYGALRYLIKPVEPSELLPVVEYAVQMCRMARVKREALRLVGDANKFVGDRAGLETTFERALAGIWMAYQPIVLWSGKRIYAYEALLRSSEPKLGNPGLLLVAAETLGRLPDLGRTIRKAVAAVAAEVTDFKLFVNLHTLDLKDETLFSAEAPLSAFARNIVLEITERASLDNIADLPTRLKILRDMGYHIALDDLGAGYAGLTSLAQLQPEVVKIDMSLVRDVDKSATKQKLVGSMATLSKEMGMLVVVEGVETVGERDTLVGLGCDLFQGYLFAKPGRPFPPVAW